MGPPLPEGALKLKPRELCNGDRIVGAITTLGQVMQTDVFTTFASSGEPDLLVLRAPAEVHRSAHVIVFVMKQMRGDKPIAGEVEWSLLNDETVFVVTRGGPRIIGEFPGFCPRCNQPAYVGSWEVTHAHPYHNIACPARKG